MHMNVMSLDRVICCLWDGEQLLTEKERERERERRDFVCQPFDARFIQPNPLIFFLNTVHRYWNS